MRGILTKEGENKIDISDSDNNSNIQGDKTHPQNMYPQGLMMVTVLLKLHFWQK